MNKEIKVSIRCTVFNHGPYLRQCLDGFVMQKTDFFFEAFVHDDASTDDSASIILEYAARYPDIIKPYIENDNLYSKRDGSFTRVTYDTRFLKGQYIAICEGDDYWTDPLKLQKQVDFLESHPNYTMCFGNAITHWEGSNKPDELFSHIEDRDYDSNEFSLGWICPTATVLFRREILESELFNKYISNRKIITGDLPLWLTCGTIGKIRGFSDVFSVYRRVQSGFMLRMHAEQRINMGDHRIEIYKVFGKKFKSSCLHMALVHYRLARCYAREEKNIKQYFRAVLRTFRIYLLYPVTSLKRIPIILKQRKQRLNH